MWCSCVHLRQTVCPRCPIGRWCQSRSAPKTQPLKGCVKGTPAIGCRGPDRIETPQTVADCGGCGEPWARRTSRGNHALCASWTTGIRLRNCACDCPLSANHFCTWPTGTPNTTSPLVPVHASAPTVSKSSGLMPALFQTLVFPRFTWMPADLKSDSLRRVAEASRYAKSISP